MILHFLTDEKFADYVIEQFSDPSMCSNLLLVTDGAPIRYAQHLSKVQPISTNSPEWELLMSQLGEYSGIVLHGMFWKWEEEVLRRVPETVKVAWMFWGGDVYGRTDVLMKKTKLLSSTINNLHSLITRKSPRMAYELPYELFQRVDYCLTSEEEEFEFAKRWLKTDLKHIWYTYYSIEETLGSLMGESTCGNDIIVGNSATIECNYFEALTQLRAIGVSKRKILLPLSYGAAWVRNSVRRFAKVLFGKKILPLVDFIPRDDYNRILAGCSVMIMSHSRPQAQGNIISGLWLGMRVYLSRESLAYHFFKRLGFVVFSVEDDLKRNNPVALASLSAVDVALNKELLKKFYSKEHVTKSVENVVAELNSPKVAQ